jgi:hypothetical protein
MKLFSCLSVAIAMASLEHLVVQTDELENSDSFDCLSYKHRINFNGVSRRTHKEFAKISGRNDISKSHRAPRNLRHSVVFNSKLRNTEQLESILLDISNPYSESYGKHLSQDEIASLTVNPVAVQEIHKYLQFKGLEVTHTSRNSQYITAEGV